MYVLELSYFVYVKHKAVHILGVIHMFVRILDFFGYFVNDSMLTVAFIDVVSWTSNMSFASLVRYCN